MKTGTLFAIKRYAIHDGPNIRTTVFFKGCPLACLWCHNPEGFEASVAVITSNEKCIGCGACVEACPTQALTLSETGITRNSDLCTACLACCRLCPSLAHEATGWETDVPTLMVELLKDRPFYEQSGGGVTFSGGDPLAQPGFLLELLKACGDAGLHRAVDTCGFAPPETMLEIAAHTDLFLFDLKHMDSACHERLTGKPNELILANIAAVALLGKPIRIRIPLIPGINTDEANLRATGAFVAGLNGVDQIDLLPYQGAAQSKYNRLGMDNLGAAFVPPSENDINHAVGILETYGLAVHPGG